jgi:hypothetical protein
MERPVPVQILLPYLPRADNIENESDRSHPQGIVLVAKASRMIHGRKGESWQAKTFKD